VINNAYISGGNQQFANVINNYQHNDPSLHYAIEQILRKVIDEKITSL
jgi:hypothetical protein